ncbi:MAG: hypothetical protein KDC18_02685 [Alphaproteobacteria bacterium]|nr:hypothetical protein [Alphaproteobacteria bacterium]MCB9930188.1 hypothetical protein [Alphaproteobacteria bacterium]
MTIELVFQTFAIDRLYELTYGLNPNENFRGLVLMLVIIVVFTNNMPLLFSLAWTVNVVAPILINLGYDPVLSVSAAALFCGANFATPTGSEVVAMLDRRLDSKTVRKIIADFYNEIKNHLGIGSFGLIKSTLGFFAFLIWHYFCYWKLHTRYVWTYFALILIPFAMPPRDWAPLAWDGRFGNIWPFHLQVLLGMVLILIAMKYFRTGPFFPGRPVWQMVRLCLMLSGSALLLDQTHVFRLSQHFLLTAGVVLAVLPFLVWWFLSKTTDYGRQNTKRTAPAAPPKPLPTPPI